MWGVLIVYILLPLTGLVIASVASFVSSIVKYFGERKKNCEKYGEDYYRLSKEEQQARVRRYEAKERQKELQQKAEQMRLQAMRNASQVWQAQEKARREAEQARLKAVWEKKRHEAEYQKSLTILEAGRLSYQKHLETQRKAEEAKRLQIEEEKKRRQPSCYPNGCSTCPRMDRGLDCLRDIIK